MNVNELLKRIEGRTPEEQAKMISNYMSNASRKKTVEDSRTDVRAKCFAGCKKLTKQQQISLLYDFLNENHGYISNWMMKNHPELRKDVEAK